MTVPQIKRYTWNCAAEALEREIGRIKLFDLGVNAKQRDVVRLKSELNRLAGDMRGRTLKSVILENRRREKRATL